MFPSARFLGIDLYYWMFLIGVLAAMGAARLFSVRAGLCAKVFNLMLACSVLGVVCGYVSAVLLQSFWEYLETGVFVWGAGATFYGGLIGAAAFYLAAYFLLGKIFCKRKEHIAQFNNMLSLVAPCIAVAHAVGRLGCLFNGCCYGAETEAWYGVRIYVGGTWQKRVPVPLFEAIFLLILAIGMFTLFLRFRFEYNASFYLVAYGVWRFCVEYIRADDRGFSGVGALTPSQLLAVLLAVSGVGFALLYRFLLKRRLKGEGTA